MVDRLPGAKVLNGILWVVLAVGLSVGVTALMRAPARADEKATLSVLQSEQMAFLVTRRSKTQIVIEHEESQWLGEWHGVLWATVSWRYGVDMKKVTAADIRREGGIAVVRLGEPELLDFTVDPGSVRFMSKATAVPKLQDFFRGGSQRQQLEAALREHAIKFAQDQRLLPTRQEIVQQLNDASALLERAAGAKLRFE